MICECMSFDKVIYFFHTGVIDRIHFDQRYLTVSKGICFIFEVVVL